MDNRERTAEFITSRADAARVGLGSDLVIAGGWGFVNNVLPIDLANDRTPLPEQVEAQTRKVLANFDAIVKARRLSRDQVVAVRIALVDLPRLEERVETAYAGFFTAGRLPARSVIGAASLPRGALIAMDFTLYLG
ncbi:MAG TPA: RidA family protein [Stellaceae bacterium]|jgi:2-iminobutanoate/2-iminopropanoate deaminase|nr:RidA family protein [Stellaceae bacterium]